MKLFKYLLVGLFFISMAVPFQLQAQSRFQSEHLKYVDEARTQAIAGTLVPMAIGLSSVWLFDNDTVEKTASFAVVYGLTMGPSMGNFYAKDYVRGMLGVAARVGGGLLMLDATRELAGDDVADGLGWDDEEVSLGDTKVLIGSGIILGSAIYNVISAKASVQRYNEKKGYVVGVIPSIRDGQIVPMFTAQIRF